MAAPTPLNGKALGLHHEQTPISNALGLTLLLLTARAEAVELTTITPKGHVTYTAGDQWVVGGAQSKLPVAAFGYQIPDPADEGTPHSTNVSVSLYDLETSKGREAFKTIGKRYGAGEPKVSRVGEWQVLEQSVNQGGTPYVILDAHRVVADVTVAIRLAWPQLAAHPRSHDRKMRDVFETLLGSVRGEFGQYKRRDGDVLRRPAR